MNLWFGEALLPDGWARGVRVTVTGDRIVRVDAGVECIADDDAHAVGVPGMPNVHSHAFQRAMAGLTEKRGPTADSFWTWRELMYRFAARLTPDDVEAIASMAFLEMLEGGFTRVGEFHYLHRDRSGAAYADPGEMAARIAAAANATGIGLTLLPVFYGHSGFGGAAPKVEQRRFIHDIDGYVKLLEASRRAVAPLSDAVVGVAPHSLRAVMPDELVKVAALADDAPIHIHIAEQTKEVDDCFAWSGKRPVEWLLENAEVDRRWCLVHATHIIENESATIANSGAVVGLCPITEANLGDGIFPAPDFIAAGGAFGIGSDSNVLIDAAEELRLLEYGQRLANRQRNVLGSAQASTGGELYRRALAGGAQALQGNDGAIAAGHSADIVSLNTHHPALASRDGDALLDSWIFAARRGAVDCVWRRGEKVVSAGRHRSRGAIAAGFQQTMTRLRSGSAT